MDHIVNQAEDTTAGLPVLRQELDPEYPHQDTAGWVEVADLACAIHDAIVDGLHDKSPDTDELRHLLDCVVETQRLIEMGGARWLAKVYPPCSAPPLDVPCPYCGAGRSLVCIFTRRTGGGHVHVARWQASAARAECEAALAYRAKAER